MVTYTSICFSMIELIRYVRWLSYRLICNHFGWNETSVLGVQRKSRYHDYMCTYILQNGWNDMVIVMTEWWVHMQSWLKWNQSTGDWKEIKVRWLQMNHCEVNRLGIEYKRFWLDRPICIWFEGWYLNSWIYSLHFLLLLQVKNIISLAYPCLSCCIMNCDDCTM